MNKDDLSLVSTDDLLEELMNRYQTSAIGLWRPHKSDETKAICKTRWHGDTFVAMGLCSGIQHELGQHQMNNGEESDDDD